MRKTVHAAAAVALIAGVVTAVTAVIVVADWSTSGWAETPLLLGVVALVFAVGLTLVAAATTAAVGLVDFFITPARPPGLDRIARIIELHAAEQPAGPRPGEPAAQTGSPAARSG
jgi:hypothetical protein